MKTNIPERIAALREAMKEKNIDAYIIPSSDPHLSEYPADRWKSREWISGFDGSAGTVVVTADKAGLWTDSRYFLQAGIQLEGSGIELYKMALPETPTIQEFLLHELESGQTVGTDGQTYSVAETAILEKALRRKEIKLETSCDLIDLVWKDRPAIPDNPLFEMPVELSGKSVREKLDELTGKLQSREHMLALFIRRDLLGQIQLEVAGLRAYLDEEHIADLQCEAEHALAQLQTVRHLFFGML